MSAGRDPVVRTEGLTKRFGDLTAVDGITFEVQAGEVLGFLGPNGSGKTTTIRLLLGLLLPTAGRSWVLGFDSIRETEAIRQRVGYMSQRFALYHELTVWENLQFYAGVYGIRARSRLQEVLELLELGGLRTVAAGKLPLGLRQRLALAVAIVHAPRLLFLDEPTSGVDPKARRAFWDLIYELSEQGVTVFVTTHYMDEAEYCSRVAFMRRGRLLAAGPPSTLKRELLPGQVWRLDVDRPLKAIDRLQALPGVHAASLDERHVRLIADQDLGDNAIAEALRKAGLSAVALRPIQPTLEDIFVLMAGG